ncbi:hypothetical protein [Actinomadura sp. 3N508]|uniref:hypothetical protein n=1 Tax=Actinomadura sp. 3N508 TaxID=3375153 RepID=UPI0037BC336B
MAEFADLRALIGPPELRPPSVLWESLEAELGLALPADYKMLAETYPSLKFDDFLGWFHPGIPADPATTAQGMKDVLEPLRVRLEGEEWIDFIDENGGRAKRSPFPVYPEPRGVLQWGMTDNGDRCLWLTSGAPDEWTIVIERSRWWHFQGGLIDFLVGVLTQQVQCPLFPTDFPESMDVEQSLD